MDKKRLESFSDGVLAIIITIMVLELKIPKGDNLSVLQPLIPVLISYFISFVYIGIYWTNHHHLLFAVHRVNGKILWANLHLLFWLSLVPFVTGWMGENNFSTIPVALYGVVLLLAAIAYFILAHALILHHGEESLLAKAFGKDFKGKISVVFYLFAIPLSFINPWLSFGFYILVAGIWIVPDKRIEKILIRQNALNNRNESKFIEIQSKPDD